MSEFKFACPVCGQHITCDSRASGSKLECPTCFQKIIIPQAPASEDAKFILSATKADKPARPMPSELLNEFVPAGRRKSIWPIAALGVLVLGTAAAVVFRNDLFKPGGTASRLANRLGIKTAGESHWKLDLTGTAFPEATVMGRIHGTNFVCERVTLQGGTLSFRQGRSGSAELGLSVQLPAHHGEELSSRLFVVATNVIEQPPKVTLRWKNEEQRTVTRNFASDYAMKLQFGGAANGRMPGKIYICLPDEEKSYVVGTFDAEIRQPPQPKTPKTPKTRPPGSR
jgi:hypothetical protein